MSNRIVLLGVLLVLAAHSASAFTTTVSPSSVHLHHHARVKQQQQQQQQQPQYQVKTTSSGHTSQSSLLSLLSIPSSRRATASTTTHLSASSLVIPTLASGLTKISPVTQAAVVFLSIVVAALVKKRRAYLFQTDPTVAAPLPDGK
jgi:CBS domain containing-hemolysin-like protein